MKTAVVVLAGGLAAMVTAQNTLSECATECVNNMNGLAGDLGCSDVEGDELNTCLCRQVDYAYGIRDCSSSACTEEEATEAYEFARSQCAGKGIDWEDAIGEHPDGDATVSGADAEATATDGEAPAPEGTEDGATPSAETTAVPEGTSPAGEEPTDTAETDEGSAEGGDDTATATDGGDEATNTADAEGSSDTAEGEGDDEGEGSEDDGSGAIPTAAPAAGLLVAAGIAALLL